METAGSEGSLFDFGNTLNKTSATITVTPIAAPIPPAMAIGARGPRVRKRIQAPANE
jgi:hypothetical protein